MNQLEKGVDTAALQDLYRDNEEARIILDHFASRERNWSKTTVDRLLTVLHSSDKDLSRGDVISVFKELETIQCGKFIPGRHGWPSRFEWEVQMVSVGRVAAGEPTEVETVSVGEGDEEEEAETLLEHRFCLRPDQNVSFKLPRDISSREAERLSEFIKSIPFE